MGTRVDRDGHPADCWHTGAIDELTIARPGRTPAAALDLIRRHGATHTSIQIAEMLNAAGLTTGKGKPFTAGGVARVRLRQLVSLLGG